MFSKRSGRRAKKSLSDLSVEMGRWVAQNNGGGYAGSDFESQKIFG